MRLAFGLGVALLTTSAALAAGDAPGARAAARALLPPELAPQECPSSGPVNHKERPLSGRAPAGVV